MSDLPRIFDTELLTKRRARALADGRAPHFLMRRVLEDLMDRLAIIQRRFGTCLVVNACDGRVAQALSTLANIETVISADSARELLLSCPEPKLLVDTGILPFEDKSLDCIVSPLTLHWVNDVPGLLAQMRRSLRDDGLLLVAMLGGRTLHELRSAWLEAEVELTGGASPRVAPFADIRDFGSLLQRAGLALPVVDSDTVTVTYETPLHLFQDLKAMGASNCLLERSKVPVTRRLLLRAGEIYRERFPTEDGARVTATFEILTATAWAPDASQQQPLKPGSAKARLADALGVPDKKL